MPAPTRPPIRACELDHGRVHHRRVDDPGADRIGDVQAEHREGDEIEKSRPEHRILRPQHPGRDDGRDRVRSIVQAVQEVEQQRDRDQDGQDRKTQRGVHVMARLTLAQ
jgi:hypothetical protein